MKRLALLIAVLFYLPCTSDGSVDGSVESGAGAASLPTKDRS
ncbi:MAG TPA: hypothetical protein VNN08_01115 [Thermoanaerobaculia bacterium]|nr:hypothetical protein [Thermoanaerobaculia bacterium]